MDLIKEKIDKALEHLERPTKEYLLSSYSFAISAVQKSYETLISDVN